MSKYDWLLLFHIVGAFLLFSGSVVAGLLHFMATRRERPSEIGLLLGLIRPMVVAIGIGGVLTLGLGLWLVHEAPFGYSYGDGWVIAAIVLWFVGMALGGRGGRPLGEAGELARRLGAEGDQPSEELRRALVEPRVLLLNYLSMVSLVAILVVMVWKPGA